MRREQSSLDAENRVQSACITNVFDQRTVSDFLFVLKKVNYSNSLDKLVDQSAATPPESQKQLASFFVTGLALLYVGTVVWHSGNPRHKTWCEVCDSLTYNIAWSLSPLKRRGDHIRHNHLVRGTRCELGEERCRRLIRDH